MTGGEYGICHRAIVRSVTAEGVTVEVPLLAPGASWGPIPTVVANLAAGEQVLVAQVSTSRDTLVVIGRIPGRAPTIAEIATLAATITTLAAVDAALDTRLGTAETDIDALIAADLLLDGRLDTAEADIVALEAADTALDARLDTAEASITSHASRLAVLEALKLPVTVSQATVQSAPSTSYVTSTYLTLPVTASTRYRLETEIFYKTTTTVDTKFKFVLPAGSSLRIAVWGSGYENNLLDGPIYHDAFDGFEFTLGGAGAGAPWPIMSARPCGHILVGNTGGNFGVQFRQDVADASNPALLEVGSMVRLTRQ